ARADPRLLLEALAQPRILHELRVHQLERAPAARAELLDDVDRPHAALRQRLEDAVVPRKDAAARERDAHVSPIVSLRAAAKRRFFGRPATKRRSRRRAPAAPSRLARGRSAQGQTVAPQSSLAGTRSAQRLAGAMPQVQKSR